MLSAPYHSLKQALSSIIPASRLIHDELRTLAYGTDASFYRLIPKLVAKVESEEELLAVLREARTRKLPLTFRGAGTSLSGQAVSDSLLVMLGPSWNRWSINGDASRITLQPGVIGSHANLHLAPHGRKIGPDPASINAAMIGGIAANNASGMCCGTAQNSYKTLASMRIIFADGCVLDTANAASRAAFTRSHTDMFNRIDVLARRARANTPLAGRIRRKFSMKNTTGYSLNALVDFEDPFEIIQHLMIGSEGTLGFIAEITYVTVPEYPHKASALMTFPDIETACVAVATLKNTPVDAVELMDRASLRSVQEKAGMPPYLRTLDERVASLLVETRAPSATLLAEHTSAILDALSALPNVLPPAFTDRTEEFTGLWNIRKGLFPSVGAMRRTGTTVIIEDVAFPVPRLAEATLDLQALFRKYRYDEAIIFGHALEGNLHFVFTQEFTASAEVDRYRAFMDEVTGMVVKKYDGSLKAEHGTGRNMAPFVELEWGREAYGLMREIKGIFDPENLLNPGVILNDDPQAHIKNLKPMPAADPLVDKCIECGFCEVQCPSRNLTLTPRQRIVSVREMARLRATLEDPARLKSLTRSFQYEGDETCATDGLCATSCPVEIDTGKMIKHLRHNARGPAAHSIARIISTNMTAVTCGMRAGLGAVHLAHRFLGTKVMGTMAGLLRSLSGKTIPLWNPFLPGGASRLRRPDPPDPARPTVVYFPSCINRAMGPALGDPDTRSLSTVVREVLERAGFNVSYPANINNLCCGMAFASKGFTAAGDAKAQELERALFAASDSGRFPVLVDMSPCLYRMKETFTADMQLYEPVRFILDHALPKLTFCKLPGTVAVHTTCSAEKMGLASPLKTLAGMCSEKVVVPQGIGCCGWAGDRGFTYPELNASALAPLRDALPPECQGGYSTSRTCEIGLSLHSGKHYQSILYLVEKSTRPDTSNPQ
jgi:D-lactate dehydrogenase